MRVGDGMTNVATTRSGTPTSVDVSIVKVSFHLFFFLLFSVLSKPLSLVQKSVARKRVEQKRSKLILLSKNRVFI